MLTTQREPVDGQRTGAFLDYWHLVGAPLFFFFFFFLVRASISVFF